MIYRWTNFATDRMAKWLTFELTGLINHLRFYWLIVWSIDRRVVRSVILSVGRSGRSVCPLIDRFFCWIYLMSANVISFAAAIYKEGKRSGWRLHFAPHTSVTFWLTARMPKLEGPETTQHNSCAGVVTGRTKNNSAIKALLSTSRLTSIALTKDYGKLLPAMAATSITTAVGLARRKSVASP